MTNVFHGLEQYSFSLKEGEEELEYTALPSTAMRTELFHLDIVILQWLTDAGSLCHILYAIMLGAYTRELGAYTRSLGAYTRY